MIDLAGRLEDYCASRFDRQDVRVRGVSSPTSGVESDVYFFRMEYGPPHQRLSEDLAIRVYTRVDAYNKCLHEFRGMRQLHEFGYPVPSVLAVERDQSPLDRPFVIMERVLGQDMWPVLNGSSSQRRAEVLIQFSRLLVQLHSLPYQPFADQYTPYRETDRKMVLDRWLEPFRLMMEQFPIAGLKAVFEWLVSRQKEISCPKASVIHSDFHPGNVLLREDGSAFVIDWAGLDVSDPRFDLGHTLLLLHCVAGPDSRNAVLTAYEASGAVVDHLDYFEVAASFRWFLALLVSLRHGADKIGLGPNAAAKLMPPTEILQKAHDILYERTDIAVLEIRELIP
jgi:aminoglycoside phosphotransferase (APT) family kinase protein